MKHLWLGLALFIGCADKPAPMDEEVTDLDRTVRAYADAAWKADQTKTHATAEHPVAKSEMRRCEDELRDRMKSEAGAVRNALDKGIARFDRARQVAPPGEIERAAFRMKALQELKSRLGL
jgi:hypothetical protein